MRFVNTKTIIPLIIILILLFIIKNIAESIIVLNQNSHILINLKNEEELAKQKNKFLKERLNYVTSQEFIENEAREKLGMVKNGENIILIPPPGKEEKKKNQRNELPNWEKWKRLFF